MTPSIEGSARQKEWSGLPVQGGEQWFRKGFLEFVCWALQGIKCVFGGGGGGMREERHPNRLHGIQRQAVAWWLEERGKLEQPVCKIQGRNRAEVGSMPGQRVWRCEPGPDHSGSVFSMRRLDFSFYGKESH